jgi:hypothetical protein
MPHRPSSLQPTLAAVNRDVSPPARPAARKPLVRDDVAAPWKLADPGDGAGRAGRDRGAGRGRDVYPLVPSFTVRPCGLLEAPYDVAPHGPGELTGCRDRLGRESHEQRQKCEDYQRCEEDFVCGGASRGPSSL